MDTKGPKVLAGSFSPPARLSQHLKDERLILDTAVRRRESLERLDAAGFGDEDNAAIIRAFS